MTTENALPVALLIDDNSIDNYIAKRIIEMTGFASRVVVTSSCAEALAYLTLHELKVNDLPAVIFLDIHMPLCDGFDFLDRFNQLNESITSKCKIVILSSSNNPFDIERIQDDDHVIEVMTKPISEGSLNDIRFKNR